MIKGEFKKRFDDLWDGYEFNVSKLDEIMDEAHKEYPLESNPRYRIEFRTEKEKRYYVKIGCTHEGINRTLLDNDRDAWFLKWFGEVKPE